MKAGCPYHFSSILSHAPLKSQRCFRSTGFSLVEVAIAMGVVAVGLVTIVALIPVGLSRESDIRERRRASTLFETLEVAVRGQREVVPGRVYEIGEALQVAGRPIAWRHAGGMQVFEYLVNEDGSLLTQSGSELPQGTRQRLRLEIQPPDYLVGTSMPLTPLRVSANMAWPATAQWVNGRWRNAIGSANCLILYQPDAN